MSSVTDGDTIVVSDGRRVRLAQVDAPETSDCWGSESTAALKVLVADTEVSLRQPTSGPEKDKYGRTLADVSVDGVSVDEALVAAGDAEWYEQFAHEDAAIARRLEAAEIKARSEGLGLWSACKSTAPKHFAGTVTADPPSTTTASAPPAVADAPAGGACHPAYPDECIPPGPPDLDCGDIGHPVRVDHAHGDPHRFDANRDGWGCESS